MLPVTYELAEGGLGVFDPARDFGSLIYQASDGVGALHVPHCLAESRSVPPKASGVCAIIPDNSHTLTGADFVVKLVGVTYDTITGADLIVSGGG
jgi:hypothetical protein